MSRIILVPLKIPSGVECHIHDQRVFAKGTKGSLEVILPEFFKLSLEDNIIKFPFKEGKEPKNSSALQGTWYRCLANVLKGVSEGFEKTLELVGVGYKAELQKGGLVLKLSLGYSHDIFYSLPEGITIVLEKPTLFKIKGVDKQKVGQTAAEIIRFRSPEPYKGKGVRVPGQFFRMKEGKTK